VVLVRGAQVLVASEGGVAVLVGLVRQHMGTHPELVHCACAALANLASLPDNQSVIVDLGGADVLIEVLRRHRCVGPPPLLPRPPPPY
jgi:hypothetical protein